MKSLILSLFLALAVPANAARQGGGIPDTQKLEMALDYLTAGKYHEALVILAKLDKKYRLNPRFKAYLGVCYYYEWDYAEAARCLDEAMPHLEAYAPGERSLYYNTAAESHFELKEYDKAIPLYEKRLIVCRSDEKGDALRRLGYCYMFKEKWANAAEYFSSALAYYTKFPNGGTPALTRQLRNMINGCKEKQALNRQ